MIHCASPIRYDLPMSVAMSTVYAPTKVLLEAAARLPALRAFCYMSSASVNINRPRNSTIEETIYPLGDPVSPTDGIGLAKEWLQGDQSTVDGEVCYTRPCSHVFATWDSSLFFFFFSSDTLSWPVAV